MGESQYDILQLRDEMRDGFARMDKRFTEHDERFDLMDKRFAEHDERFTRIDERFARMDERFARIDERFEAIDDRFDRLERRLEESQEETRRHFDVVTERTHSLIQLLVEQFRSERCAREGLVHRVERLEEAELSTRNRLALLERKIG